MEAEGIRRGAHHIRQLTIVGDGAAWIWDIATGKFSEATQIVGIWHAREHLHDLARVLELMLGDQRDEWLAARLDDLDHGDINGICAAAHAYYGSSHSPVELGDHRVCVSRARWWYQRARAW